MMGDVFVFGEHLIIWLGDASLDGKTRLEAADESVRVPALLHRLKATWFRRPWVLQEVLLSNAAPRYVMVGPYFEILDHFIADLTLCKLKEQVSS